jgi:hypothetical protein
VGLAFDEVAVVECLVEEGRVESGEVLVNDEYLLNLFFAYNEGDYLLGLPIVLISITSSAPK